MNAQKRVAIFHGTGNSPYSYWIPWLVGRFEASGCRVFCPLLPGNNRPNQKTYDRFLRDSGWDFADSVLVGHSSGATTILNLLSSDWFPQVSAVVLVGTFLNEKLTKQADWYQPGQFDHLFLKNYDPDLIKQKADKFYFIHGSDDPFCDIADAKKLCNQLGGEFIIVENGHHLGDSSGIKQLPQIVQVLKRDKII